APAHDPGWPADADAGLHRAVPRAGLRATGPAQRLGEGGRARQPVHRAGPGRPRLHLRLGRAVPAGLRRRVRARRRLPGVGGPRRRCRRTNYLIVGRFPDRILSVFVAESLPVWETTTLIVVLAFRRFLASFRSESLPPRTFFFV